MLSNPSCYQPKKIIVNTNYILASIQTYDYSIIILSYNLYDITR